jgi:DNA-binding transcriptional ArsR family regulator
VSALTSKAARELDQLDRAFNALAHQARRTVLLVLLARGGSMTSGEIANRFDCTWPTMSRHLRVLQDAGLVTFEVIGRERHYRLNVDAIDATALAWLSRFTKQPRREAAC